MSDLRYNLKDKVALVTGGSRGIGLELAGYLLKEGARVAICGRKQENLDAAVKELKGGDFVHPVWCGPISANRSGLMKICISEL